MLVVQIIVYVGVEYDIMIENGGGGFWAHSPEGGFSYIRSGESAGPVGELRRVEWNNERERSEAG